MTLAYLKRDLPIEIRQPSLGDPGQRRRVRPRGARPPSQSVHDALTETSQESCHWSLRGKKRGLGLA